MPVPRPTASWPTRPTIEPGYHWTETAPDGWPVPSTWSAPANHHFDKVKRRLQKETLGTEEAQARCLYRIRKLFLSAHERLDEVRHLAGAAPGRRVTSPSPHTPSASRPVAPLNAVEPDKPVWRSWEAGVAGPLLMTKSRHGSVKTLNLYAKPTFDAVAEATARSGPVRRRGAPR